MSIFARNDSRYILFVIDSEVLITLNRIYGQFFWHNFSLLLLLVSNWNPSSQLQCIVVSYLHRGKCLYTPLTYCIDSLCFWRFSKKRRAKLSSRLINLVYSQKVSFSKEYNNNKITKYIYIFSKHMYLQIRVCKI